MKRFKLFLAISTFALLNTVVVSAQDEDDPLKPKLKSTPIYVGPVLGYNRTYHSVDLATYNSTVPCPIFTNGDNNGYFFGASMEYILGSAKDSKSSIIGRILYNTFPASFSKESGEASTGGFPSLDQNGNPVYSDVLHTNEVKMSTITLDAMYKFNFMGNLGVVAGLSVDYILSKTQEQKMSLVKPANASFKMNTDDKTIEYTDFVSGNSNPRGIILKKGDIKGSGIRGALKAGIQYEIITKSNMYIVPSLSYNLGLTSISDDQTWRVSAIQLGVDIRFAIK